MVIIEYVPYGDLLGYLRKSRGLNDNYYKDPDVKPKTNLTPQQLMKFAWQVADGMNYLSSKKVTKMIVVNYLYQYLWLIHLFVYLSICVFCVFLSLYCLYLTACFPSDLLGYSS